jgi:hypothetical protein
VTSDADDDPTTLERRLAGLAIERGRARTENEITHHECGRATNTTRIRSWLFAVVGFAHMLIAAGLVGIR